MSIKTIQIPITELQFEREPLHRIGTKEMTESILNRNALSVPIPVVKSENGYLVIGHEYLYLVAKSAGLKKVPVRIVDNREQFELDYLCSVLSPQESFLERSEKLNAYKDRNKLTQEQLAGILGKNQSWISRTLSISKFIYPSVREKLSEYIREADESRTVSKCGEETIRLGRGIEHICERHLSDLSRVHHKRMKNADHQQNEEAQIGLLSELSKRKIHVIDFASMVDQIVEDISDRKQVKPIRKVSGISMYHGDAVYACSILKDQSVDLVITSPPYGANKKYEKEGPLIDHLDNVIPVLQSSARCLRAGCWMVINFIDWKIDKDIFYNYDTHIQNALLSEGMSLVSSSFWKKTWSYKHTPKNEQSFHGEYGVNRITEKIMLFKKSGKRKKICGLMNLENKRNISFGELRDNFRQYYEFPTNKESDRAGEIVREAVFPKCVPDWFIRAYSCKGEVVLDPFAGAGTTLEVAKNLDRIGLGFEIHPEQIRHNRETLGFQIEKIATGKKAPDFSNNWRKSFLLTKEDMPPVYKESLFGKEAGSATIREIVA